MKNREWQYYWEWYDINDQIFPPRLINFTLMAIRWRISEIMWNKDWAENVHNRFNNKISWTYTTRNKDLFEVINLEISESKKKFKTWTTNYLLWKVIEYALEDIFWELFFGEWVRILKSSEYDDIKSWVDYIVEHEQWVFWVDLKLSSSFTESENKRKIVIPVEYNIYRWKKAQIIYWNFWKSVQIKDRWIIRLRREPIVFEPNLVMLYLRNYIEFIRKIWYNESNKSSMCRKAWNLAVDEYQNHWNLVRSRTWMSPSNVVQVVQQRSQDIFELLIQ